MHLRGTHHFDMDFQRYGSDRINQTRSRHFTEEVGGKRGLLEFKKRVKEHRIRRAGNRQGTSAQGRVQTVFSISVVQLNGVSSSENSELKRSSNRVWGPMRVDTEFKRICFENRS